MKKKITGTISIILIAAVVLCAVVAVVSLVGHPKIKVGVISGTLAYKTESGEWTGYDIDFATKLFTQLGYKVEFVEVNGVDRTGLLEKGKIDCYMSATDLSTDARFIYSDYYIESKQVLFYKNFDISENAQLKGLRVGVVANTENEKTVLDYTTRPNVLDYSNNEDILGELSMGSIDVAIFDYMYAEKLKTEDERFADFTVGIIYDVNEHAIATRAKDTKLQQKINEKIAEYKKDNYLSALKEAYSMQNYYY